MLEAQQAVRFDHEQPAAADVGDAVQFSGLADARCAIHPAPARPEIFLVLAADEALEIDTPDDVIRFHEIQRRKRNGNSGCPTKLGDAGFGSPDPVPAGVTIVVTATLVLF